MVDIDDFFGPLIEKTLFLWVIPYAIWYFASNFFISVWDWVTEPENNL